MSVMATGGGLEPLKGVSRLRPDRVQTMAKERDMTRDCGVCFTAASQWVPNVLTKIRSWHTSGWTWWAPRLHTSALRDIFVKRTRGGDL